MIRKTWDIAGALLALTCVIFSCSRGSLVDGGVSETTNGIVATIVYQDSVPCAKSIVRLRPVGYGALPSAGTAKTGASLCDSITDENGTMRFTNLDSGSYIIEINDTKGNAIALKVHIPQRGPVIDMGKQVIQKTGSVRGIVSNAPQGNLFLQIRGLERIATIDSTSGVFSFDGLPSGIFASHVVSAVPNIVSEDFDSVDVKSNDTTHLAARSLFRYSRTVVLNTTSAGADVAEAVFDFPMLIRLTSSTFDFSQARSDGADIRFFKNDNTPLPFEIERWDPNSGRAEIWVKLDTVLGNNGAQSIRMMWGCSVAPASTRNGAVFDTASGFAGVWHLGEPGDTFCLDATVNMHKGTPYYMTSASSVPGLIGLCHKFNGESSYFQMHGSAVGSLDFPQNGSYSLSAWVYVDSMDTGNHVAISKGNRQYYLKANHSDSLAGITWNFAEYEDGQGWQASRSLGLAKTWTYLTALRNGTRQYLYVNGICVDSVPVTTSGTLLRETGNDLTIGRYIQANEEGDADGFCYFNGLIDEVRICNRALSTSWIKLCYMNQKTMDALVTFK